jgi:hypothetical protein
MRAVVTVLAAFALVPLVAGCQPRTVTDPDSTIYCEVMPDAPDRDNADAPRKIIGAVRYRCDEPGASSLELTVRLQREKSAGTWVDVASTSLTARGATTVPGRHEAFRTKEVSARCGDGVFRTQVTGRSVARGVTKRYDVGSPRAFDPCHPGLFAH